MAKIDFSLVGGAKKPETSEDGWHMMLKAHDLIREANAKMALAVARAPLTGEECAKLMPLMNSLAKAYEDSTKLLPYIFEKMKAE